jgi:L-fuconolactonase
MNPAFTDAHVHFWDLRALTYPWLAELPPISGVHTPAELRTEAAGHLPDRIVFVQCGGNEEHWQDEVTWVEALAAAEPRIAGIVAYIPVNAGIATTQAIADLKNRPLVRGVRHLVQGQADPHFCLQPEFVAGVQQLGEAGLSFDLCCLHPQLPAVTELVRRCPGTSFILDHAGKPGIRARLLDPWRSDIAALAALPNVVCKFSGLVTEADPAAWKLDDLQPYATHLLATFGPSRLLFGSDWPVVKLAGDYLRWLGTARALLSHLSSADRDAIFRANTLRIYRLN